MLALSQDLAQREAAAAITAQIQDKEVGLLVYNAGYSAIGAFFGVPLEDHLREIDTNIRTQLILVYYLGQAMAARRRGGIILMSSLSAMLGSALIANYAASKAYIRVLGEGLWEELRSQAWICW